MSPQRSILYYLSFLFAPLPNLFVERPKYKLSTPHNVCVMSLLISLYTIDPTLTHRYHSRCTDNNTHATLVQITTNVLCETGSSRIIELYIPGVAGLWPLHGSCHMERRCVKPTRVVLCSPAVGSIREPLLLCLLLPIQNAASRLVFNQTKFARLPHLLRSLHWLQVAARTEKH